MEPFKNILVVRTDRMGDVVLTTPAVKALREHFPQAHLTMLVTKNTKDIVVGNKFLDGIIAEDRQGEHRGFWGTLKLINLLRRKKFDLAIVYHTKRRTNYICFLAGIPRRIGYKNDKFGFLLTDPLKDARHLGLKHEAQYCLDVLKEVGIDSKKIDFLIPNSKLLLFHLIIKLNFPL